MRRGTARKARMVRLRRSQSSIIACSGAAPPMAFHTLSRAEPSPSPPVRTSVAMTLRTSDGRQPRPCRSRNTRFVQMPGEPEPLARGRRDAAALAAPGPAMAGTPAFRLVGFCSSCPWRSPAGMPGHSRPTWRERTAAVGPRAERQHHPATVASRSWRQHHRPRRKRRHASPATDACCPRGRAPPAEYMPKRRHASRAAASRSAAVGVSSANPASRPWRGA